MASEAAVAIPNNLQIMEDCGRGSILRYELRREIYAKEIKFAQMGVKYFIQVIKNYRQQTRGWY
jgi:hypothetical protein